MSIIYRISNEFQIQKADACPVRTSQKKSDMFNIYTRMIDFKQKRLESRLYWKKWRKVLRKTKIESKQTAREE